MGHAYWTRGNRWPTREITLSLPIPKLEFTWTPPANERTIAEGVISFLTDRRVLYDPYDIEVTYHCVMSVQEIRHMLLGPIRDLGRDNRLSAILSLMQAACRKFLSATQGQRPGPSWMFFTHLGSYRSEMGPYIAELCAVYQIDLPDELAGTLPEVD